MKFLIIGGRALLPVLPNVGLAVLPVHDEHKEKTGKPPHFRLSPRLTPWLRAAVAMRLALPPVLSFLTSRFLVRCSGFDKVAGTLRVPSAHPSRDGTRSVPTTIKDGQECPSYSTMYLSRSILAAWNVGPWHEFTSSQTDASAIHFDLCGDPV
jgi:hypothetical protein